MSRLRPIAARLAPALLLPLLATLGLTAPAAADPAQADLSVTLDASPKGLGINAATFTANVTNTGPSAVSAARVWFSYPAGFTAPSASGCTLDKTNRTAVCALGAIPSGATVSKKLTLHAGLLASGSLPVTAALVDLAPADPDPGNNSAVHICSALTLLLVSC
ncbi:hypothetical protein ACIBCO_04590 [Streptomyces violascens]|uniref:hypothetical protein n=1 Tax=Streptomyces violascens TaxID=67381 RepID=UPI00379BA347